MTVILTCIFAACDKVGAQDNNYTVTIHPNNGQADFVWDIKTDIPVITKYGYHIAGFYLDEDMTISTTLESLKATGITQNIDVYVKWEKDVCDHVEVIDNAVAPTCTASGLTQGKHCSVCGKILQAQTEIPALGHTGGTATCTEPAICAVCGEKYENAHGHKYGDLIPKIEPTCSATGVKAHYKCSDCNKVFKDDEHKTETTLDDLTIAINPNAHNFGKWIKNESVDTHTRVCSFNSEHTETENCHGGTATCIEQATCEKCNAKYGELSKHDYKDGVCIVCGIRRPSEGLNYSLNSNGAGYTATGLGTCTDNELIIPSEYNAKPVTSIGEEAFRGCTGLTSVKIPDSVTSIGSGAFYKCSGLMSVTIPESVTSIGNYAFVGCSGLTSVTIPDSVTSIGSSAFSGCAGLTTVNWNATACTSAGFYSNPSIFQGCSNLATVNIGDNVTTIPFYAFSGCSGLTSITIPDSVTSIGEEAFRGCTGLTSVTIPDSVASIGKRAFSECAGLTSVKIPDSVTSIGKSVFYGCSGLASIIVVDGNSKYHSAGNCLLETATKTLILGCKTSVIPTDRSVTSIGEWAFSGCSGLTSITIPDSVTSIGEWAFYGCTGLTSVTIPNSVTSIGAYAFWGCKGLTSVTIPNSVTSIGYNAFYNCTGLTSVTIPNSVTSIDDYAFYGCTGLTSVTIPNSVMRIGDHAFV